MLNDNFNLIFIIVASFSIIYDTVAYYNYMQISVWHRLICYLTIYMIMPIMIYWCLYLANFVINFLNA